jgi:protein SCO1/2
MKDERVFGLLAVLLIAGITVLGCSRRATVTAAPDEKTYPVRGLVRALGNDTITVEHEDVPDFMPAMTMPFVLKHRRDVAEIHLGDAVQFQLHVSRDDSWISNVQKIDAAQLHLARESSSEAPAPVKSTRLKEGDAMPEFNLVDQKNRPLTRETFRGKALLLTFIFTRCPMPNYCPLISNHFSQIEKVVRADAPLAERVRMLSVTLDPEFDTPEVLANYSARLGGNDVDLWRFATGKPNEVKKLTSAFSVYVQPEGGTISHGLATVLVGTDGVIRKIWRGNVWTPDEVLREVRNL